MRIAHRKRSMKGSNTATAYLPRDILATSILVRLPGSDLRRLRRVCKQWRDIISDPAFIHAHMVLQDPRLPPTHTIVFFPGTVYGSRRNGGGRGFLLDEDWRLTAELAVGRRDELVGACNGLLCFLEAGRGSLKIVEPFTGESLAVPLPPEASGAPRWTGNSAAYCFGFDSASRRYKIVHHDYLEDIGPREGESVDDEVVHVYTVGAAGKDRWTRVRVARKVYGEAYGDPSYVDGAVYWPASGHGKHGRDKKLVRFDLATEKVTLEAAVRLGLDAPGKEMADFCRPVDLAPCVMTYGRHCEWDVWFPEAEAEGGGAGCFPGGCVLLSDWTDGGLYLRTMKRGLELDQSRKLLFVVNKDQPPAVYNYNGRVSFVRARRRRKLPIKGGPPRPSDQYFGRTFGYTPTVSAAPLALYLGMSSPC